MSHNLRDRNAFVSYRRPAWHGLGLVTDTPMSATEAAAHIRLPRISTESLLLANGQQTGYKAVLGEHEGELTVYCVVREHYRQIDHAAFVAAWDRVIRQPIETMGLLGKGETLFISTKLPTIEVKGDETEMYLLGINPLTGNEATAIRITPVRVVCQNTLQLSASTGLVHQWRVVHTSHAARQFEEHLRRAWEIRTAKVEAVKEALELLASTRVTREQRDRVLADVYPVPEYPAELLARAESPDVLSRLAAIERDRGAQLQHRERCVALFEGEGRGSQTPAAAGTAWGVFNAVAEYEDYFRPRRQEESRAFGTGADRKAAAFDACLALART